LREAIAIIEEGKGRGNSSTVFTEIMQAFIHLGSDIEDFAVAEEAAKGASSAARFFLSVHAWDMDICEYYSTLDYTFLNIAPQ
jgi:hypothetical protein